MKIRLQPNDMGGILGICGYYVSDAGLQGAIEEIYLQEATLEVKGERITDDVAFLTQLEEDKDNKYAATCVKTKVPYKAEYKYSRIKVVGPRSVTYWH
jgi:hypothetical protein